MYAGLIVDITGGKLDKVFTYRIPEALVGQITLGMQVIVPFGRGNRQTEAYVIELMEHCSYDPAMVKDIIGISPKGVAVEGQLIQLAGWMKEPFYKSHPYMRTTFHQTYQCILLRHHLIVYRHLEPLHTYRE